jgi:anti-sigma factor RsiW
MTRRVARMASRNGYNLVSWNRSGVTYWAVSDLNGAELQELQQLL